MATNPAVTQPLYLTDLHKAPPGLRRVAHGYATSGNWKRVVFRAAMVAREVAAALPRDLTRAMRPSRQSMRIDPGRGPAAATGNVAPAADSGSVAPAADSGSVAPAADSGSVAMYVHYSATGQVSGMVRRQLEFLNQLGFAVVFISMATQIPDDDWQAVRGLCALAVQRENFGRDFGAWHAVIPEVRRRWPHLRELMLANDSVLGPIYPLAPMIEAMRAAGDGLFGLTESLQGGAHLQSYLLLARGSGAVDDLGLFLDQLYVSHSKWLLVQLGEIRLARWMRRRGHRVAAVFGYDRLVRAAVADPAERRRLMRSHRKLRHLDRLPPPQAEALLHQWPLNPTQHLWHVLASDFGDPFVKTELVLNNPGSLPDVDTWPAVVPPAAPCPLPMLQAHLETMRPA